MLRSTIQTIPDTLDKFLGAFEYKYNSSKHHSTQLLPFEVEIGRVTSSYATREIRTNDQPQTGAHEHSERLEASRLIA